jgi:type I pantothenate kinase
MQALLSRWPNTPKVELITTDGFLYPNAVLQSEGLLEKKGFPESYDGVKLLSFVSDVKAGERHVRAPVYSHVTYDIVPGESIVIDRPDILILEGLNVLSANRGAKDGRAIPFVSDFFDFTVYLHAAEEDLERWFIGRFMRLRDTAFRDPASYFKKYAGLDDAQAEATARGIWTKINLRNLRENILPTMPRASLVLTKGPSHVIEEVELRKL